MCLTDRLTPPVRHKRHHPLSWMHPSPLKGLAPSRYSRLSRPKAGCQALQAHSPLLSMGKLSQRGLSLMSWIGLGLGKWSKGFKRQVGLCLVTRMGRVGRERGEGGGLLQLRSEPGKGLTKRGDVDPSILTQYSVFAASLCLSLIKGTRADNQDSSLMRRAAHALNINEQIVASCCHGLLQKCLCINAFGSECIAKCGTAKGC